MQSSNLIDLLLHYTVAYHGFDASLDLKTGKFDEYLEYVKR